jgi:uncharacterized protein (DUF1499 family)
MTRFTVASKPPNINAGDKRKVHAIEPALYLLIPNYKIDTLKKKTAFLPQSVLILHQVDIVVQLQHVMYVQSSFYTIH